MNLEIVFTPRAIETFLDIITFIQAEWGNKSANKFVDNTYRVLNAISKQPLMFKASELEKNIRKGLISRQTSFFYRVKSRYIEILFFWDNRQKPVL